MASPGHEVHLRLGSPTRRRIHDIVRSMPGTCVSEIAKAADVHWGTVHFHVTWLSSAGLVRSLRVGRRRLLFDARALEGAWPQERTLLSEPVCRQVAIALVEQPGLSVLELAQLTGISTRALYYHLKRLSGLGLAEVRRTSYTGRFHATTKLHGILAERYSAHVPH